MNKGYQMMREGVNSLPLLLDTLPEKQQLIVDRQFPYSFGIEWEINTSNIPMLYPESMLHLSLPLKFSRYTNIYRIDQNETEFRQRFWPGKHGLLQLYWVCEFLKKTSHPNPLSGLHYHIDCTDVDDFLRFTTFCETQDWVLDALISWGYTGTYNKWTISMYKNAVRMHHGYDTIEFRIGEMSFDYSLIVKRVKHCQAIVQRLKYLYKKKYSRTIN